MRALFSLFFSVVLVGVLSSCGEGVSRDEGDPSDLDDGAVLCGDGLCHASESCVLCSLDCGGCTPGDDNDGGGAGSAPTCGDGTCDEGETCDTCEGDCGACDWPAEWSAKEAEILRLVNEARANGATCPSGPRPATHPFTREEQLDEAARLHSLDMAEQGYFSHTSLDGRSPWDRISDAGYTGAAVGENIAAGSATAQQAFNGWMSSEGHCRNIMSDSTNEMGVGYATVDGSPWGHYWTQTFGAR